MPPEVRDRLLSVTAATTLHAVVAVLLFCAVADGRGGGSSAPANGRRGMTISLLPANVDLRPGRAAPSVHTAVQDIADTPRRLQTDRLAGTSGGAPADAPPASAALATSEAGPAGGGSTPVAGAAFDPSEVQQFRQRLQAYIERYRRYPPDAQRNSVEGVVLVRFVMDRDGHVTEAWIDHSSGSVSLDNEAVDAIRRAAPLPSIPASLPPHLAVTLPIVFTLG